MLKIKCPYIARNTDPVDAMNSTITDYVCKRSDAYSLGLVHDRGYYEQVQGTVAIAHTTSYDFVIWRLAGVLTNAVAFDSKFCEENMRPALVQFFNDFVVEEILTEHMWQTMCADSEVCFPSVAEALHEQELTIYNTRVDYELFDIDECEEEVTV